MKRRAFTLIELTIVIAIFVILAGLALAAANSAYQQSKVQRTQAIVAKIDQLIGEKYESYRTRPVPIRIPQGRYANGQPYMQPIGEPFAETPADSLLTNGIRDNSEGYTDQPFNGNGANGVYDLGAAEYRLLAMRELQRMEMPNQKADVAFDPMTMPFGPPGVVGNLIFARPSLSKQYLRRALSLSPATPPDLNFWTPQYEGAECLYLILASMRDGDKSALDYFSPSEIGDFDGDRMNEILDSFGQPIEFVRWPSGHRSDVTPGVVTPQSADNLDPFDPLKVDGRARNNIFPTIALKPLVYSAGTDKLYQIGGSGTSNILADPFHVDYTANVANGSPLGTGYEDNITNHDLAAR